MKLTVTSFSLRGRLLIATDAVEDPAFRRTVVFLCAHSPAGAMGLVVNRTANGLTLRRLMSDVDLLPRTIVPSERIHAGGPAETERGFVLHSTEYSDGAETLGIDGAFALTATRRVLSDLSEGRGPKRRLIAMGYAGWGPGQLETELGENAWFTADADPDLVFGAPDGEKWRGAVQSIGIDGTAISGLSALHGHA
jgi:putative transcriptional regulator